MKFGIFLIVLASFLWSQSTDEAIRDKQNSIKSNEKLEIQLNKKLEELASDIVKGEESIKNLQKEIGGLSSEVEKLKASAQNENSELERLTLQNKELIKEQKDMEQRLIRIISQDFAYDLIAPEGFEESRDSIVAANVLKSLNLVMKDEFNELAKSYENTINLIKNQESKIEGIRENLKEYTSKQNSLKRLQTKQENGIKELKRDEEIYHKKLAKLKQQQDELRKTLEQLKILQKEAPVKEAKPGKTNVKQLGSSYQESSVKRYKGQRTIAPLDDFVVKQKFGDYVDPIYKIKIFNESVVLRSKTLDAKVKNVLDGKVVFAKETQILEKVVIVENQDGIHTIYAHLDKISPSIKVGSVVKKGYVLGRVKQDLTFEVTQKNYHIDPLEMIKF